MAEEPTVPVNTLVSLFDLTDIRIQQLAKVGIVRRAEHGQYFLWQSIKGYIGFLKGSKRKDRAEASPDVSGIDAHKLRLTRAKADIAELDAELKKGTVHAASDVADVMGDMIANARAKFLGFPSKLAGALDGLDITEREAIIREHVNELLTELRDYRPTMFSGMATTDETAEDDEDDEGGEEDDEDEETDNV